MKNKIIEFIEKCKNVNVNDCETFSPSLSLIEGNIFGNDIVEIMESLNYEFFDEKYDDNITTFIFKRKDCNSMIFDFNMIDGSSSIYVVSENLEEL